MTHQAKRWTPTEESRARESHSAQFIAEYGIAAAIAGDRATDRRARAKIARRESHIYRHGQASANRWY